MQLAVPVVLCCKDEQVSKDFIETMKPEYDGMATVKLLFLKAMANKLMVITKSYMSFLAST